MAVARRASALARLSTHPLAFQITVMSVAVIPVSAESMVMSASKRVIMF